MWSFSYKYRECINRPCITTLPLVSFQFTWKLILGNEPSQLAGNVTMEHLLYLEYSYYSVKQITINNSLNQNYSTPFYSRLKENTILKSSCDYFLTVNDLKNSEYLWISQLALFSPTQ